MEIYLYILFILKDNNIQGHNNDMTPFYALCYNETTGYLARAAVNKVLQGGAFSTQSDDFNEENLHDETCKVS